MSSCHITSWQIEVEKWQAVTDFIFLDSKITVDGDRSHEIKRCLHLGRTAMTNLDTVLKSIDISLLTKVYIVKVMVFPAVMDRYESWIIKKAEPQRTDTFKLWYRRKLLRVPCISGGSNQSILKDIGLEYSLEGLMLKLKLQSAWCLKPAHWKNADAEKDWRRREWQQTSITDSMDINLRNCGRQWTEEPGPLQSLVSQKSDTTQGLNNSNKSYSEVWKVLHLLSKTEQQKTCVNAGSR